MITKMKQKGHDLLRKSEKYTKTDMVYLAKGGSGLFLIKITTALAALGTAILFANFFPKEAYGNYKYVLSLAGILGAFSLSGITTAIIQAVARGKEGIYRKGFSLGIKWSLPVFIISAIGSIYYFTQNNTDLGLSLLLIAIFVPIKNGAILYRFFLIGKKDFGTLANYSFFYNFLPAFTVGLAILFTDSFVKILLTTFIIDTIISLFFYFRVLKKYNPNNIEDSKTYQYSKHMSIINILDVIATYIDKILIFQWMGATQLAVYTFATAIPEQIRSLMKMAATLATPKLATRELIEIKKVIFKKILYLVLISIPIIIAYVLIAPVIFKYLFPAYTESVLFSQVFIIIIVVEGGLAGSVFKAKMLVKESYISNIIGNILKLILLPFGILYYGLWGLIVARIISRFVSFLVALVLLIKSK